MEPLRASIYAAQRFRESMTEENRDRFTEEKAEYITKNLDHARWSSRLDEDLFARFLNFYDQAIQ